LGGAGAAVGRAGGAEAAGLRRLVVFHRAVWRVAAFDAVLPAKVVQAGSDGDDGPAQR